MFTLYAIIFLVLGLIIGSLLNVLVLRIDDLGSVVTGRSKCPHCGKTLAWYDLVPIFSFVTLGGKCRYCHEKISWQYPLVELLTGLLFLFLFLIFGLSLTLIFYLVIFSILTVIFVHDLKTQLVPEQFVWAAVFLAFLGGWYFGGFTFGNMLIGGLIGGGFLGLLALLSREKWMGYGDFKVGLILGFLTGYPTALFTLFLAFVLGSVVGVIYILFKNKKVDGMSLKTALPFAPFLIFSTLIGLIYGGYFINWYLGRLY